MSFQRPQESTNYLQSNEIGENLHAQARVTVWVLRSAKYASKWSETV